MDADLKKILKAVVLEMRHELEGYYDNAGKWHPGDLETRLAEIGVRKDRASVHVDELGRLIDEDVRARKIVDAFITVREQAGVDRAEAVAEYIRESAYTWANRLVALRCMEARELLDDEVIVGREAYGGRSLVHHRLAQSSPGLCTGEDDGRFAMLAQVFAERAKTLPMLFDPDSPSIALRPSPAALKNCLAWLSGTQKVRSQEPATDAVFAAPDALGWAYQYWNTEEKDRVFETVRTKKGAKIEGADIIPATQLYTEDYMVKFLVQNSLGATWMRMHPDSKLFEGWEYYVRDADRAPAKKKPLRQITLLDPACGSGHFLIEAFDMLYLMYEEEGSLKDPESICKSILENNLFGIDIDERAVQIAEAALWMKAEEKSFGFCGANTNLVAATSSHLKGESWERFLTTFEKEPHIPRVLREFARTIEHIDELGSLARPFEALEEIIKAEHEIWEEQERERRESGNFLFQELRDDLLATQLPFQDISDKEFFERTMRHALYAIDGFTKDARESGELNDQLVGTEAKAGFKLLALLGKKYDVIVANPPYMGTSQVGTALNAEIQKHAKSPDIYCALILRWIDLQAEGGVAAFVTRSDYLTQSECEEMRERLLSRTSLQILMRLENKVFRDLSNPNAIFFSMQVHTLPATESARISASSVHKGAFETKAAELRKVVCSDQVKARIPQRAFSMLPRATFALGLPNWSYEAFANFPRISEYAVACQGLITGDTSRFLRYRWEHGVSCRWTTYAKGGEFCRWFGNDIWSVDWQRGGVRLRNFINPKTGKTRSRVQNTKFYGRRGATWSSQTVSAFATRVLEADSVFDTTGSSVFLKDETDTEGFFLRFLAVLNSPAFGLMFRAIQPGVHYGEGYLETLPCPRPNDLPIELEVLAQQCIDIQTELSRTDIRSTQFVPEVMLNSPGQGLRSLGRALLRRELKLQAKLHAAELDLWAIAESSIAVPESDRTIFVRRKRKFRKDFINTLWQVSGSPTASPQEATQNSFEQCCVLTGTSPLEGMDLIEQLDESDLPDSKIVPFLQNVFSLQVLAALGHRWSKQRSETVAFALGNDGSGIALLTHVSNEQTLHTEIGTRLSKIKIDISDFAIIFGRPLEEWLTNEFFKHHTRQFNRRPIAWQLQSSSFTARRKPTFSCLVYFHRINNDLIAKIQSQYTGPIRSRLETELRGIVSSGSADRSDRQVKRVIELEESIAELQAFDEQLAVIARSGFGPDKLLPTLRQYALDDAMLSMKACWLQRLSEVLNQLPVEDTTNGVRKSSPLDDWQDQAIKTELHEDLAAWIDASLSHLSYFCSQVGPKAPDAKKIHEDPSNADFGSLIQAETALMQTCSMKLACGMWWGRFDAAVLAPIRERIKILKAEQKELNAAIKEDRQPMLVAVQVREESSEYDSSEIESAVTDMPLLGNHMFEPTTELTKAAMKARLKEVKAKIKKFTEEMDSKAGKAQAIRDAIQAWQLPDPIPASLDFSPSSPNLPPLFDQVSSLDERRSPPKTIADFIAQESLYAPDINDGVRVNIAPLQKAGVLAADVLAAKDVDKAIADRAEWRADERRWVREGKLPQPGWWKQHSDAESDQ